MTPKKLTIEIQFGLVFGFIVAMIVTFLPFGLTNPTITMAVALKALLAMLYVMVAILGIGILVAKYVPTSGEQ